MQAVAFVDKEVHAHSQTVVKLACILIPYFTFSIENFHLRTFVKKIKTRKANITR